MDSGVRREVRAGGIHWEEEKSMLCNEGEEVASVSRRAREGPWNRSRTRVRREVKRERRSSGILG